MMLVMRAGRISARVLGVFDTIVFHTCSAADRTVYATSLRAMYRLATTCRATAACHKRAGPSIEEGNALPRIHTCHGCLQQYPYLIPALPA